MSKTYAYPPPDDHAEDIAMVAGASLPCRVISWIIKAFDLPVDLCGIDFAKDLMTPENLKLNPVHSLPFLRSHEGGSETGINGSEAILDFLCSKYREQVPDSFYPSAPLARAKVMEKFHFINVVAYRATMYQYVYPTMGLMSECQYDLCKRDFALDTIEAWCKESSGQFMCGDAPCVASYVLASLYVGNCWVQDAKFEGLPWRHCDVIEKYPCTKRVIDAVLALPVRVFTERPLSLSRVRRGTLVFRDTAVASSAALT